MWMTEIADGIYAVYTRADDECVRLLGVFALEDMVQQRLNGAGREGA